MIAGIAMSSIGNAWLTSAITPLVPSTAVRARTTGTAAATSAPNVRARMSSVTPKDMSCELPSSAAAASSSCFVMLASPNCSTAMPWWRAATWLVVSRIGWMRSTAVSGSPLRSNWTRTE